MLDEAQRLRPVSGALNLPKRYIADCALNWWSYLGRSDKRSKDFVAFADQLYRLAGFKLRPGAVRAQLVSALKRRNADVSTRSKRSQT